jgi:thioredoxin 1
MKLLKLEKNRCGNCTLLGNFLEDIQAEYEAINVENHPEVAAKYGVMAAPVLILVDDNDKELDRMVGFSPGREEEVAELLQKLKGGA